MDVKDASASVGSTYINVGGILRKLERMDKMKTETVKLNSDDEFLPTELCILCDSKNNCAKGKCTSMTVMRSVDADRLLKLEQKDSSPAPASAPEPAEKSCSDCFDIQCATSELRESICKGNNFCYFLSKPLTEKQPQVSSECVNARFCDCRKRIIALEQKDLLPLLRLSIRNIDQLQSIILNANVLSADVKDLMKRYRSETGEELAKLEAERK